MLEIISDSPQTSVPNLSKKDFLKVLKEIFSVFPSSKRLIELKFVRSPEMQKLNFQYRGKNKPTDVLSFSFNGADLLGIIIIDLDMAKKQAKAYGHSFRQEVLELFIHGVLHLLGMDHETLPEADLMKTYEKYFIGRISKRVLKT